MSASDNPDPMLGYDKATILRLRGAVQSVVDLMKRWESEARTAGDIDKAERHRWTAWIMEHKLLGYPEGGCVIVPFDERWLNDGFRTVMGAALRVAADQTS